MFLEYMKKFHLQDCLNILADVDILGYYNINIDFLKLFETYPDIGDKVLCSPVKILPACDKDILKLQQKILEEDEFISYTCKMQYKYLKRNVHARFFGLPVCPELHRTIFPKNVDLGCFLKVTGTVVRVTQAKMLEYQRMYVCIKCKFENSVEADFESRYILKAPTKCGNTESRCKCSTFTQVNLVSREHCRDYQEIKIQEQVNKLSIGSIPGSMWVVLEDDLVDCCKPGDDVVICGTVRRRWRPSVNNKKSEVEIVLQANYIEVSNSQRSEVIAMAPDVKDCFDEFWLKYEHCPLKGRDQILSSVCPQVYGLYLVKLAVLLTVITGSNHIAENKNNFDDKHSTNVRGQCHLLLVGDPGTGKSQLLKASAELTPRSVFTSGAGSTRAGLTCAALREDGEWQLEAGALVLSDDGVCCIDEITHLRDHDRTAIHEAMEQQTISVAKAGIVCKLNTRCAVIAACNPKGHYQSDQPLNVNVSLGTPLLSRFDLIFILLDSKNKTWDNLVSSYILFGDSDATAAKKNWTIEKLQMYIGLIGPRPTNMTKSANAILQCYYMMQRKSEYRDPSRTTVRMLDSLIRLSQAHCRLMYRTTILPTDAIIAISLIDLSMQDCTLDDTVDALHSTFEKYPDFDYLCTAKQLLTRLSLYEIWTEELLYYGKLLDIDHKTLEHHIDNKCNKLFARYDDVTDNNIPLSISLVTSSYFKKNKDNGDKIKEVITKDTNKKEKVINDKLAATLKKHATLNIIEKKPPVVQKKKLVRRKRKEVTFDTSNLINQNGKRKKIKVDKLKLNSDDNENNYSKESEVHENHNIIEGVVNSSSIEVISIKDNDKMRKNKKSSVNKKDENLDNKEIESSTKKVPIMHKRKVKRKLVTFDKSKIIKDQKGKKTRADISDNDEYDTNPLNKVPSVNDVYSKIGIDFNLESDSDGVKEKENASDMSRNSEEFDKSFENNKSEFNQEAKITSIAHANNIEPLRNRTLSKLKKFEFQESSDFNKFYNENSNHQNRETATVHVKKKNLAKPTRSSSQISMFESSDCEIDMEI